MEVVEFGGGQRIMNATLATSPVSDGAVILGSQAGLQSATLTVRCWGTPAQILASFTAIEAAFNQLSYTLTVQLAAGPTLETWACQPANVARGNSGRWEAGPLAAGWQDIALDIPRQPDLHAL